MTPAKTSLTVGTRDVATSRPTSTDLDGLLRLLIARWQSLLLATFGGLALAIGYLALTPQTFTASTTLFIDPRPKKVVSEDSSLGGLGTDLALLESQVAIIRSDAVLSRVVDTLKLTEDGEFAPPPANGIGVRIKALLGITPPVTDPRTQAISSLAQKMAVKRAQKTYVVEIEASSSSPVKAARMTQAIVDAYLADQTSAKSDEAQRANTLIEGRLGELRERVRRAETDVDAFRKANRILTSEGGTVGEQQLTKLNSDLITARSQVAEAKARLDEVQSAARSGNPDAISDPTKTGLLQRLREQLAQVSRREASLTSQLLPKHPVLIDIRSQTAELKSQIAAELKRLAASALGDFKIAENREREQARALDVAKLEVGRTNTAAIKQRELDGEVSASRELLRVFLARSKETDEQQKISTPDARMISPPSVPTRASKPVVPLILALGLLGGLAVGVARALLLDQFGPRGASADTISTQTGLPLLGSIPALSVPSSRMPSRGAGQAEPFTDRNGGADDAWLRLAASPFGPFIRALSPSTPSTGHGSGPAVALNFRLAVLGLIDALRHPNERTTHIVMVASAQAEAGTTTTALALAYAAALQGEKVLLIDAASATADLSQLLAGPLPTHRAIVLDRKSDLASIVSVDPRSGLSLLPIALADLRLLKNLQRVRLLKGLEALSSDFDLVVVDGGAVLEDASATLVAPFVHQVVLVQPATASDPSALMAASRQLDRVRDRLAGVVLTRTTDLQSG